MSFLFYQPAIPQGTHHLDIDESRHAVKVLRMKTGDALELTDGSGFFYQAVIKEANPKECTFSITGKTEIPRRPFSISIAIAPTKNIDRTEWFVEKAIETGIEHIHFMLCKNSERKSVNIERMNKIAVSAMKQSRQARLPGLHDMTKLKDVLSLPASQKFLCFVDHENPHHLKSMAQAGSDYLVLIGPEGDFAGDELALAREQGFAKTSLGSNRLRTETAALTACQVLNFINL